MPDLACLAKRP